ncbi:hypothetical protein FKR81_29425 [Lentzea tibetensis]|uniref:Uncharacterized protein n=1 Tax=Lentzea tibetensis TaxID=2591470 RepID=A0A563ELS7_9PSEU|nr:hypothetical protein [Lentzea tibetensis]TWP48104.1 hypothetical protein FKR81_29425 [Lentzea tibetensis]
MHRPLMVFGTLMTALIPISVIGLLVDDRVLVGSPIWFKPLKFAISLALYGFTLAWFLRYLSPRHQKLGWWAGTLVAVAGTAEMAVIVGQVVRGKRSHFNFETTLDGALFSLMGTTIVALWVFHAIIAILLLRTRFENQAMAWSIRLGLVVAFFGLGIAFLMTRPMPGQSMAGGTLGAHSVGAPDGGSYMAITGWSTEAGDMRVPHFVGIHAVQVLPIVIALLGRWATPRLAWVLGIGYFGLFLITAWQALRGQPVTSPDALTVTAYAGLAALTGAASLWAVRPVKQVSYA